MKLWSCMCAACKHFGDTDTPGGCTAFTTQIPAPILLLQRDHRLPYPGDQGIRFEPRADLPADVVNGILSRADGRVAPEAAALDPAAV